MVTLNQVDDFWPADITLFYIILANFAVLGL